jgi:pimeloyl-ACP methyl ester carboxylesterase
VAVRVRGDGAPIFLLPGNGHDGRDFDAIAPVLSKRFRTYALDWPGFGESEPPQSPASASAAVFCGVAEDVITQVEQRPAVLLGNSVGGLACLRFAARHPGAARGLILVDTAGFARMSVVSRAFCRLQGREAVRRVFGLRFASWYMKRRNAFVAAALQRVAASRRVAPAITVEAAVWRSFASERDAADDAREVLCPTLIAWGRRDPIARLAVEARRTTAAFPEAGFVELDTGHVPFLEDPEQFLRAIGPFLETLA